MTHLRNLTMHADLRYPFSPKLPISGLSIITSAVRVMLPALVLSLTPDETDVDGRFPSIGTRKVVHDPIFCGSHENDITYFLVPIS